MEQLTKKHQPSLPKQFTTKFKVDRDFAAKKSNIKLDGNRRSCDYCRKRKVRCELVLNNQCSQCRKAGIECKFQIKARKVGPPKKQNLESLQKQVQMLEQLLQEEQRKNSLLLAAAATPTETLDDAFSTTSSADRSAVQEIGLIDHQDDISSPIPSSISQRKYRRTMELIEDIPELTPELTDRLVNEYFQFIHLNSAFVDRRGFLLQYYYEYPHPVNEHLFYALCAIGSQYLPRVNYDALVRRVGRRLREKAMTIMNIAYKKSCITTIQVLIMISILTPHSDNDDGLSTNWLILGAAIRMAQDLGIHTDSNPDNLSESEIQVRRRIAYTLYVLDKISAASTGRPFTLKDEEFDVPLPLPYEVDPTDPHSVEACANGQPIPKLLQDVERDIREKRPIYSGNFESLRLGQMIGYVLSSFYNPKMTASPRIDIEDLDTRLMTWQLNPQACFTAKDGKTYVRILYDSVLLLRYQSQVLAIQKMNNIDMKQMDILNICNSAAVRIIERFEAHHIWGCPFLRDCMIAQAAAFFLQSCNSDDDTVRFQARRNLARCANLYKGDDIANRTKNAIALYELSSQLLQDEESKMAMQRSLGVMGSSESCSSSSDQELSPMVEHRQLFGPYEENLSAKLLQQERLSISPSTMEPNIDQSMQGFVLHQHSFDVL
ncbi:fungal-specific transcription factor domain-containing protein [Phascolomyces articulosus]|uniref:Fungal-specific transcription factor domain-containing protein n=1 Tax=Phascolomyces articulosus TaxID=60185 RepID=A0AAD5KIV9_9FUNG|nr:fungal-specific transcription factor domain-containing protein [Phascolomyces articulosus]